MYQYDQAIALSKQLNSTFVSVDLKDVPANFLFNNYVSGFIKINYTYSATPIYIDIASLKKEYMISTQTISDIIASKPDGYFKDIGPDCFNSKVNYVKYSDAVISGYSVSLDSTDITLDRPDFDTDYFINTTLTTVNGYIHSCNKTSDNKVSITNGALTTSIAKTVTIGILTFSDIGNIIKYPINALNVVNDITTDILTNVYIKTNIINDSGYIHFMSLGGYLIPINSNGALNYLGGGVFSLSLNKFGYLNKILESSKYCYLGDVVDNNQNKLNIQNLSNEYVVRNYLTLTNSFIFSVPAKNIITNKTLVIKQPLYNSFKVMYRPDNPLFTSTGRMVDYYYVEQDYEYLVTATNIETNNYNTYESSSASSPMMTYQRDPNEPLKNSLVFKQLGFY